MPITIAAGVRKAAGDHSEPKNGRRGGRRVVVTGMGCVTPYGPGVDRFWDNLVSGRSGLGPLTAFDPTPYGTKVAGQIRDFEPSDFLSQKEISASARCVQFALASARMALDDARLSLKTADTSRVGVFIGSSAGTIEYMAENHAVFLEKGVRRVHPLFPALSYPGVVATQLAISFGIRGPVMSISSACTSATDAIGVAWMQIQAGLIDRAIVGGTEAPICPFLYSAFDRLGVMSREVEPSRASRPFAADRDGFIISEGAGVCIIEALDAALERGASIGADLTGYGATSDGFHPFSPLPTGEEGERAIRQAMEYASVDATEVDYVSAHAIGSIPNDPLELRILESIFAPSSRCAVSSMKSMIGHTMGASGALQLITGVCSLRCGLVPPTTHLEKDEVSSALDVVTGEKARSTTINTVVMPTFGFGSRNAALVIQRYEGTINN